STCAFLRSEVATRVNQDWDRRQTGTKEQASPYITRSACTISLRVAYKYKADGIGSSPQPFTSTLRPSYCDQSCVSASDNIRRSWIWIGLPNWTSITWASALAATSIQAHSGMIASELQCTAKM